MDIEWIENPRSEFGTEADHAFDVLRSNDEIRLQYSSHEEIIIGEFGEKRRVLQLQVGGGRGFLC